MSDADRMEELIEDIKEAVDDMEELGEGEDEEQVEEPTVESPKQRWIREHGVSAQEVE